MAQIKPVGSSAYVTLSDYLVASALMDAANDSKQNNVLIINKTPYQLNTLVFGGGAGTWDGANFDVIATFYNTITATATETRIWDFVNDIEEGTVFSPQLQATRLTFKALIDRSGFTGAVDVTIEDPQGLFNTPFDSAFTIPAASSVAVANLTVRANVPSGTYRVTVKATDGITEKSRVFYFIYNSSSSSSTPGEGWEDIDL